MTTEKYKPNPNLVGVLQGARMPYALIGVGIPGSGKTEALTAIAEELDGIEIINPGAMVDSSDYREVGNFRRSRFDLLKQVTREALGSGRPVIIDSHNTFPWMRKSLIEIAREAGNFASMALVFSTPLEVAIQKALLNPERQNVNPNDIRRLYEASRKYPVSYNEGFELIVDEDTVTGYSQVRD